jgi:hypothetical protein
MSREKRCAISRNDAVELTTENTEKDRSGEAFVDDRSVKPWPASAAFWVEADLRVVFFLEAETVWSVDIGTHAIYRN